MQRSFEQEGPNAWQILDKQKLQAFHINIGALSHSLNAQHFVEHREGSLYKHERLSRDVLSG
jgi:hypothetical protein